MGHSFKRLSIKLEDPDISEISVFLELVQGQAVNSFLVSMGCVVLMIYSEVAVIVTIILSVSVIHICRYGASILAVTARLFNIRKEKKTKQEAEIEHTCCGL